MDWHEIWERKGRVKVNAYDLETLLSLDGYDIGAGRMSTADFLDYAGSAVDTLELHEGARLLEVGCGAGALLWAVRDSGVRLFGVDYSAALIEHARRALPEATLAVAEAAELPFEADGIVCCGVFHYFPDLDYARRVLDEFRRVAPLAVVMDVPDLATREASERARAAAGSKPGDHLYYPRSFFAGAKIFEHQAQSYGNAPFRFHALLDFRV